MKNVDLCLYLRRALRIFCNKPDLVTLLYTFFGSCASPDPTGIALLPLTFSGGTQLEYRCSVIMRALAEVTIVDRAVKLRDFVRHKIIPGWFGQVSKISEGEATVTLEEDGLVVSAPLDDWEVVSDRK